MIYAKNCLIMSHCKFETNVATIYQIKISEKTLVFRKENQSLRALSNNGLTSNMKTLITIKQKVLYNLYFIMIAILGKFLTIDFFAEIQIWHY